MMFKTVSYLVLVSALAVFQAQATLVARDDPSVQATSGNGAASPSDPTLMNAGDQGENDKWGWGYGRWGCGYPWYGYGYDNRRFYGGR